MAYIEYSLFRASFVRSSQGSLFANFTPREVFLRALEEKPSTELRRGYRWHIGNLLFFTPESGYFAVGRTTKSNIEKFDESSGNFIVEELETSPYTHCVFDTQIGILGIARKTSLAPTVRGIARRIQELLSNSRVVAETKTSVEIAPIPDPEGFVLALASAYRVARFVATFHGPNPFDADEYFQKPLSIYLASASGKKGKAEIQGDDLDRDVVQSVARSTAATGNEASATIGKERGEKLVRIHLKGDAIKRVYDEDEHDVKTVIDDLRSTYQDVRNR